MSSSLLPQPHAALSGTARSHPILVYQMGKVGSRTVFEGLAASGLGTPIFHLHRLAGIEAIERELAQHGGAGQERALEHLALSRHVRDRVVSESREHWNVITLVRDPVARNLSSFFYNLSDYVAASDLRQERREHTLHALVMAFLNGFDHAFSLRWFEQQLEPFFGIDVFAQPFSGERGYAIQETERCRLLILRTEDMERVLAGAMERFLGLSDFRPPAVNLGKQQGYAQLYRDLLDHIVLPPTYLSYVYDSRLARHFYTHEERAARTRFWSDPSSRRA